MCYLDLIFKNIISSWKSYLYILYILNLTEYDIIINNVLIYYLIMSTKLKPRYYFQIMCYLLNVHEINVSQKKRQKLRTGKNSVEFELG